MFDPGSDARMVSACIFARSGSSRRWNTELQKGCWAKLSAMNPPFLSVMAFVESVLHPIKMDKMHASGYNKENKIEIDKNDAKCFFFKV